MHFREKKNTSHKEQPIQDYRDHDPKTEEFEKDAKAIMLDLRVADDAQIQDTERLIFEINDILMQFTIKVAEQENISISIQKNAEESVSNVKDGNKEL